MRIRGLQNHQGSSLFVYAVVIPIILIGLTFRIVHYCSNRSLWFDEAQLALHIVNRSFSGLTQPLDNMQGAPLGFLMIEKAFVSSLGNADYVLRLFPLLSGCVSLYLFFFLVKQRLGLTAAAVASALMAVSDRLIYYSAEAKQYSTDVAVCLLMYVVVSRLDGLKGRKRTFVLLGMLGSVALCLSHSAIFVLAGIGPVLLIRHLIKENQQELRWVGFTLLSWAITFLVLYLISLRHLAANAQLLDYWRGSFMPFPPWEDIRWFVNAIYGFYTYTISSPVHLAFLISLIGACALLLRDWDWGVMLLSPPLLVMLASGFHKYPFSGRLILFAAPNLLLLIAAGLEHLRFLFGRNRWLLGIWFVLLGAILCTPLSSAVDHLRTSRLTEEIKPVMSYLNERRQMGDLIYVYPLAVPAFTYYAPLFGFSRNDYILIKDAQLRTMRSRIGGNSQLYLKDLDVSRGKGRVWFVFSHVKDPGDEALFLYHLEALGQRISQVTAKGATAYLFYLRQPVQ